MKCEGLSEDDEVCKWKCLWSEGLLSLGTNWKGCIRDGGVSAENTFGVGFKKINEVMMFRFVSFFLGALRSLTFREGKA